jgi:hypothetical protein
MLNFMKARGGSKAKLPIWLTKWKDESTEDLWLPTRSTVHI